MKKNIIIIVFIVLSTKFYAQTMPEIPCPNNIEQVVLTEINDYMLKNNYNFNNFKIVQSLYLQVDSLDNLSYKIDSNNLYLIEVKQDESKKWNINLFRWDVKQKKMYLIEKDNYSKNILLSFPKLVNSSCNYFINIWGNSKFECLYVHVDDEFEKFGGQEFLSTNIFNYFSSLKEYLEYSCGSVENYIETYHKREDFLQKQQHIISANINLQGSNGIKITITNNSPYVISIMGLLIIDDVDNFAPLGSRSYYYANLIDTQTGEIVQVSTERCFTQTEKYTRWLYIMPNRPLEEFDGFVSTSGITGFFSPNLSGTYKMNVVLHLRILYDNTGSHDIVVTSNTITVTR